MAIFKCKMCSGELDVMEGVTVIECEYCGTKQTVPTSKDENLQGLFNRANILRMKSEFDKAEQLYEKIIEKDETQAEAYWGLILCKYGIEYVEDPATFKRIPTCHRTSFDSIIADEDYKSALSYADSIQCGIYEDEAKEIDRLQKEILELSQKEEPYDVFICYKETDNDGKRTQDSVIANDIYHQLTQEGLKVFYAAITLENKLGSAYEPCIFAALNSAKVMLAIGTKPEYFNAVWVKNEWSRFLKIIQKDRSKLLIPCYRDMDAYELPEEFAHLQAQDMSKIGFINDVVRGIKKVVIPEVKETPIQQTQVIENANGTVTALLERGFMALEDGEWQKADDFFEQVLNFDAKLAEAYLGKLMAELRVKTQKDLENCEKPFDDRNNYQKAIRFGDDNLKNELENIIKEINDRNDAEEIENVYCEAKKLMSYDDVESYQIATEFFDKIIDYKDSRELREGCFLKIKELQQAQKRKDEEFQKKLECSIIKNSQVSIAKGVNHYIGLKSDGTVTATTTLADMKYYHGECDVKNWSNVISVSAAWCHSIALKSDGTVVATGQNDNGQCDVSHWRNIVAISTSDGHTVGLKADGTVVATKYKGDTRFYQGQCEVSNWTDIVAISAGSRHTVGLKADGTVVATKCIVDEVYTMYHGQCEVSDWTDIVAISAGNGHTVGLKSDGTVVSTKYTGECQIDNYGQCEVSNWKDIVAISAGPFHTAGLKADGTVVVTELKNGRSNNKHNDVKTWKDIVSISVESLYTIGLKSDGTLVHTCIDNSISKLGNIAVPIDVSTKKELETERQKRTEISRKKQAEERKKEEETKKQQETYRNTGVCQYCGGIFKGFFSKVCTQCGKKKDY